MTPPASPLSRCSGCGQSRVRHLADFGRQPIGHHFLDRPDAPSGSHPITLGQCEACGLAQLIHPITPDQLVPRVDWIRYNEPESHLDSLIDSLSSLPGLSPSSRILGISYKEDSSLRRFNDRGFSNTARFDPVLDLGIDNPCAGVEFIQHNLKPDLVSHLHRRLGVPDLVLVRHVIEHTHDTPAFLETFRRLVAPGGYVVFELPDCKRGFDLLDYTTFWEDHTLYFVEPTFKTTLELNRLRVVGFHRYPGPYEHCLVAVTQPDPSLASPDLGFLPEELHRVRRFAESFPGRRDAIRAQLQAWKRDGPIGLFGAGHQAATFLGLFQAADFIDFVIDDHPRKCGMFMPGCGLPILSSQAALGRGARIWLSTVGAESEAKIRDRNQAFLQSGGRFASIYPTRPDQLFTPFP